MTDFKKIILGLPGQLKTGFAAAKKIKIEGEFSHMIFCGMGGSMIPAEMLFSLLPELPNNFHIHRDFGLPPWTSKNDLVICISWSGNTAETISSYAAAKKLGAKILAMTKGGELGEMAEEDGNEPVLMPQENTPARFNAGHMFSALLTVLANSGIIDIKLEEFLNLSEKIKPSGFEKKGRELAERIGNWTPLIYSSFQNRFLASFWKIKFNESSKTHAFWNYFPAAAHNEIAGFGWDNFFPIILKDEKDGALRQKKILTAAKFFEENGIPYETAQLEGKTRLEKIFNDYVLSDWTSCYLAEARRIDPAENDLIEKFKELER